MSMGKLRLVVALAAVFTGSALAQTTTTRTQDYSFPAVGLGSTETLEISLTNLASASSSGTAASCTGSVTFVNAAGTTIGSATTFTLTSKQVGSVTLPFSKSGLTGSRGFVRAVVESTTTSSVPCSLSFAMSTYDTSSGATHLFVGGGSNSAFGQGR